MKTFLILLGRQLWVVCYGRRSGSQAFAAGVDIVSFGASHDAGIKKAPGTF